MPNKPVTIQDIEQSRTVAHSAVELLAGHGATAEPEHYAVAYHYQLGTHPKLAEAINQHLSKQQEFDEFFLRDLYDTHISYDHFQHVRGMRNDLQTLLQGLLQTLTDADTQTREYSESLQQNIDQLNANSSVNSDDKVASQPAQQLQALQKIAQDLLKTAVEAGNRNDGLQQQLTAAHKDAESLRGQLEQHRLEALIDPLTGLYNRRAMEQQLAELMALDPGDTLSMLVLDIDHFKSVNDKHGHAIGDIVIRNVADTLRKCIRGGDIAIRYGGEEFMVLLPHTPLAGASRVAESIRKRIASLRLVRKQDNYALDPFTISVGVSCRRPDDSRETLFERADKALYQAKHSGRDKVVEETEI